MSAEVKSEEIEEDLEDGEIEDDDEEEIVDVKPNPSLLPPPLPSSKSSNEQASSSSSSSKIKGEKKSPSPQRKSSESKRSSKKDKRSGHQRSDEDDFMSSIESKIANVLKKDGVEPPMPNIQKKSDEKEPELPKSGRRKRRREKKAQQKRDNTKAKKRSKLSGDGDNLYMVGGSPDRQEHSDSDSESYTSYSSYDSDDYRRSNYDDRRNKRRDKYGARNERDRERDRDRDRNNRKRRDHDSEKEVCLRFAEFGHCNDEECTRVHEIRQPKKMELCKFWLMECCAKKDKCSYMHGDFPCKYYYLGLKCINKDCKFMHGKPLSDNLKQILLKHLDTAPKEILGDFPRIGRENATKMLTQTHIKLCQEFNIPVPESMEKAQSNKIPSLLEMKLRPPDEFPKNDNRKDLRNVRWKDSPARTTTSAAAMGPGDTLLSEMRGILSDKQIESMAAIGVTTVNHINNLTVSQINDIGLSLGTIGEIQATAMNMHSAISDSNKNNNEETTKVGDVDLRNDASADVDMRVFNDSLKSPDTIMSPTQSDAETQEISNKQSDHPQSSAVNDSVLMSPPSSIGIDYSQYLKDSNLNDDENEDEPGLRIDETYASDYEAEDKKDSQSEDDQQQQKQDDEASTSSIPLLPPSFDTNAFLNTPALAKVDISSSIQQLMEKAVPSSEKVSRDPRNRDPRMAAAKSPSKEKVIQEISSPDKNDRRTSIYEIESPSEDESINAKIDKDKDMRMLPFMRGSENGDLDFRFPFTPMSNYVPATEIDASFGMHVFEKYEVKIVDIPKPDYSDIRRGCKQLENTQDPRLKKLCGLLNEGEQSKLSSTPSDPRKRKLENAKDENSPKRLQISTILQNSKHYNELSSSQKMIVNDVLAELSKQLKLFHSDPSPSKIFDTTFVSQRPRLHQILLGLNVFVNAEGEFEEIKENISLAAPVPQVMSIPNMHQMPPTILPSMLAQPPPNLMMQPPPNFLGAANIRPGLLGLPPNLQQFNFQDQDAFNNQPFGGGASGDQNFNRNSNQQQRQNNNSNFRNTHRNSNNNNSNNNNYRSNRR